MATILLVEDDSNLREIYEARLKAEGYDIMTANDGEEALVVAKEKKPDLIIADVMMPKISGFEMLDILRNTAGLESVKIIMLTALGQAEDQQKASSLGADKYLVKSQVTLEDIVNAAHDLLTNPDAANGQQPAAAAAAPPATPTTPPAAPAPQPTQPASTTVTPTPVATAPDPAQTAATDDKLLNDAVNSFGGGNSDTDTPKPSTEPAATPPAPAATPAAPTTPTDASAPVSGDTPPPADTAATAASNAPTLEIDKDLASQLKEESEEVESETTGDAATVEAKESGLLPDVPPADPEADKTTVESDMDAESTTSPMKVIKPLPTQEKKDINTLLEQEQLKELAAPVDLPSKVVEAPDPDKVEVVTPTQPAEGSTSSSTDIAL